jgi:rod shape-determining protein MreC
VATYGRVRSTRLLVIGLLVASLVTITDDARGGDRGPLAAIGRTFGAIVAPLQEGVAAVFRPIGSFFTNVFRAGALAERVDRLEAENAELRREQTEVGTLQVENTEYERLLGIEDAAAVELMGAAVVAESPSNFEWAVVINRGSDDGVARDMPVVAPEGLVGRVVEVYPSSATVMLIIDPDSRVTARLATSRETGLVAGQRENPLRFDLIDAETEIVPGELVETSGYQIQAGFEGLYPPGIQIGQVERIEPGADGIDLSVLVRPNVDFSRLDRVAVVTGVERVETEAPTRREGIEP